MHIIRPRRDLTMAIKVEIAALLWLTDGRESAALYLYENGAPVSVFNRLAAGKPIHRSTPSAPVISDAAGPP